MLFPKIDVPKGRDLARLDFAEAAFTTLGDAMADIDPAPLPADERLALAGLIATAFVDGRIGRKKPLRMATITKRVRGFLLEALAMSPLTAEEVASHVLSTLDAFRQDICSRCPTRCIDRTRAHFAKEFFGDVHPALDAEDVPF
jgi:hypothetical protein